MLVKDWKGKYTETIILRNHTSGLRVDSINSYDTDEQFKNFFEYNGDLEVVDIETDYHKVTLYIRKEK